MRGEDPGALFVPFRRGDHMQPGRLASQAIFVIFEELGARAGVPDFSPHDFRRTFAGDLLDAGADLATESKLMGHSDPKAKSGYDRRGERAKRSASSLLHFPF